MKDDDDTFGPSGPLVLHVRTTWKTTEYLDELAATGAFGTDAVDVAKTLIEAGIRQAVADGIIKVEL